MRRADMVVAKDGLNRGIGRLLLFESCLDSGWDCLQQRWGSLVRHLGARAGSAGAACTRQDRAPAPAIQYFGACVYVPVTPDMRKKPTKQATK